MNIDVSRKPFLSKQFIGSRGRRWIATGIQYLPTLLIALLWFAKDFPARMSSDSITSWDQVINGNYKNDHLVIYTLYLKLISLNGLALWIIPLVQILLTIYALDKILRLGAFSTRQRSVILFIVFLTPIVGGFVVSIWKDVPFTIFLILGSTYLAQHIKQKDKNLWGLGLFYFTVGISMRHNGAVLAIFLILFVLFSLGRKLTNSERIRVSGFIVISIITSQLISFVAIQLTDAEREPEYVYSLSFAADLAYIASAYPEKADQELLDIVSKFSTGESFQGAKNCTGVGYLIIPSGFDQYGLADNAKEVVSIWVRNLDNNFNLIFESRKCRALPFIPPPFISRPIHPTWLFPGIYEPNSFGLQTNEPTGFLLTNLQKWENLWQKYALIVAWPGALGVFGVFFTIFLKRKEDNFFVLYAVLNSLIVSSLVSLWFVTISPDYRFASIAQFLGILFIVSGLTILSKWIVGKLRSATW